MTKFAVAGVCRGAKPLCRVCEGALHKEAFGRFFHAMIEEGVYLPPSPFEALFVSTAHTKADIDATVQSAARALGVGEGAFS